MDLECVCRLQLTLQAYEHSVLFRLLTHHNKTYKNHDAGKERVCCLNNSNNKEEIHAPQNCCTNAQKYSTRRGGDGTFRWRASGAIWGINNNSRMRWEKQCLRSQVETPAQAVQGMCQMEQARVNGSKTARGMAGQQRCVNPIPVTRSWSRCFCSLCRCSCARYPKAAFAHPVPSDSDEDAGVTHDNNSQRQSVHSGMDTATTE